MEKLRIVSVAPGAALPRTSAVGALAVAAEFPGLALDFHPQCFASAGHFAGPDEVRAAAFLEVANDPAYDAIWFAKGGYGAARILDLVLPHLTAAAREKTYLGYSDAGALLAALHNRGFPKLAHGPMPTDIARPGGADAIRRVLHFLLDRAPESLEPNLAPDADHLAFNLSVLCQLLGTPHHPRWDRATMLMVEETGEHLYRIDRLCFQLFNNAAFKHLKGVRLGRCDPIPENDRPFGQNEEEIVQHWCAVANVPYLGRADIGHDAKNKIVPFRPLSTWPKS